MGEVLKNDLAAAPPNLLDGVKPAAARAVGETALFQVRPFYESSLEYGRSTMPDAGLFYLGSAQAARDLARTSRTLSAPARDAAPPLRSLAPELDALEGELLGTLPSSRLHRASPGVHRGELRAQRRPEAGRGRPALRRAAALPAGRAAHGGTALGGCGADGGAPRTARRDGAASRLGRGRPQRGPDLPRSRRRRTSLREGPGVERPHSSRRGRDRRSPRRATALLRGARAPAGQPPLVRLRR